MDNNSDQSLTSQNTKDQSKINHFVIKPTKLLQASDQPKTTDEQSKLVVSQATEYVQPANNQAAQTPIQLSPNSNQSNPVTNGQMPIGISASQMGLNVPSIQIEWRKYIKRALITIAVLVVLVGGFTFVKDFITGFDTKTVTNGGYTYSFMFYRFSHLVTVNGVQIYKINNSSNVSAGPTNESVTTFCAQLNRYNALQQAFTVQLYGSTRPVCEYQNTLFVMIFTALHENHIVAVTYSKPQNSSVYPKLQTIFGSVKVSK